MNLREKLLEILPSLLPAREEQAIKGKELIARVRAVLGDAYSDHSLRSQFSFLALDPDSCLARVPNGQGYYLRDAETSASLHSMFESEEEASREGSDPSHKALALAVRLYDTAGLGVFVYPVEEEESWSHPDLVAVQWPAGHCTAQGSYLLEEDGEAARAAYRAVCVAFADSVDACRHAFFRTLSCSLWAEEAELLLIGSAENEELLRLASRFGIGVRIMELDEEALNFLPRADEIFRAGSAEARSLIFRLPQLQLAHPRHHTAGEENSQPDIAIVKDWAERCIARGRIEPYEMRVAIN